ncbi:MAG TPA: SDR family oxidoreductase [Pseudonocardiaceae bacterium]|jgi:NAD(P)-dependent dehydrogenase (short-subunit alcohol dehydrogenase family)|nr:SDR family oxidoreductase [Pseudonocardiaceae bacterium]
MYEVPDQTGRRFVITGANSGTGKEATRRLAGAGAEVIMAVRTPAKGAAARAEILRDIPGARLDVRQVDLADLAGVHTFARELLAEGTPINVLVNNAGVMFPPTRMTTADDFELQLGSNFLGPFALTNLLLPLLLAADKPRVATMSSGAANFGRIHFADLQFTRGYRPQPAYAQSKLADLLLAQHLAAVSTVRGWGLLSTGAHPGYTRTNLLLSGPNLGRTRQRRLFRGDVTPLPSQGVVQGTEPLLFAAADPAAEQGAYYGPRYLLVGPTVRARLPRSARGADLAASLWAVAESLTGTSLPALDMPSANRSHTVRP